jgi:hypothetical protein
VCGDDCLHPCPHDASAALSATNWKDKQRTNTALPWFLSAIFANGFKNPLGALAILYDHGCCSCVLRLRVAVAVAVVAAVACMCCEG